MLIKPWADQPHWADTVDELIFINRSHTKQGGDNGVGIFYWDSSGRVKLDREDSEPKVVIGYKILTIDIDTELGSLPGGMSDVALVGGFELGETEGWTVSLIGGIGSANDNHFSNDDAVYGIATLHATQTIDPNTRMHIGINYDGSRTFLPDVPLPYVTYEQKVDDTLALVLGVPSSSVFWRPIDPVTIELNYYVPSSIHARIAYYFTDAVSAFAEYKSTTDGFYVHNRENRRLFYELNRVTAGIRWVTKLADISVGIGYAFDQEFSIGWDLRDTDTLVELSDEIFVLFKLQGTF